MNATDEWYDVEELTDHSYRVAEGVMFGTYLVVGEDRALQIDAGAGFGDLQGMVSQLVDVPVTLLLTHSHWDHVGSAHGFEDIRIHDRELAGGTVEASGFSYGPDQFIDDWHAAGREFPDDTDVENFEIPPITGVEAMDPDEPVDLGGRELELVELPGHSPGQLGVLDRDDAVLYGADVIHNDHGLYIHFEGCDIHEYVETFEKLQQMRDAGAFDTLYLAHARPLSGEGLDLIDEYHEGLQAILNDELEYEMIDEGLPARRYEIAGNPVLTKPDVA